MSYFTIIYIQAITSEHFMKEASLRDIFMEMKLDKMSLHDYDRYYTSIFEPLRHKPVRFVEIENTGKQKNLPAWKKYFSESNTIWRLCFKDDTQDFIKESGGNYTIVIDDGSHLPSHTINNFELLWPEVSEGGYYIIEDIAVNYWRSNKKINGYSLLKQPSVIHYFKGTIEDINREFQRDHWSTPELYKTIESITFGHNCIILKKILNKYLTELDQLYWDGGFDFNGYSNKDSIVHPKWGPQWERAK